MSCEPTFPCGPAPTGLGLLPPPPGQPVLRRRVGDFEGFAHDLVARVESELVDGDPLGRNWDLEGDPRASMLVSLWAYVAEIVAAYSELTAAESYLGTASAWTDLRRLADLVGYRPRPRVAAQGWVRVEVEKGVHPLLPAGTRVQAPGTASRSTQTFEVGEDTQLRSDWNALTATWVPVPSVPSGRRVRFLGNPGFQAGDDVLFVEELPEGGPCGDPPTYDDSWDTDDWVAWWVWILCVWGIRPTAKPLAVASVVASEEELGTSLVEFDRDLDGVLQATNTPYAAYRILETAGQARRLSKLIRLTDSDLEFPSLAGAYGDAAAVTATELVLDSALDALSTGQTVALVDWRLRSCDLVPVKAHEPVQWEIAPGTPTRASKLVFDESAAPATLAAPLGPLTAYVVDRRIVARHYEFPGTPPGITQGKIRIFPAPAVVPATVAVETTLDGKPGWEVLGTRESSAQEPQPDPGALPNAPRGLILDLVGGEPQGELVRARASANLARVRHGATARTVLGSGDGTRSAQSFELPDAPIAYDLDAAGNVVPTQVLRVEGVAWTEVPSLYGVGPAEVFAARLGEDGGLAVGFGDGEQGARLPTGRGNVTSTYRVGGGTEGEVASGEIDSLLGSVGGVKKVEGAGPTSGGADQDDERRLRTLAPARARAFGRAISLGDLVDLSLGYPGVTHAAAWEGTGPPGCACGGTGLHLAFLRRGSADVREPEPSEVDALASFLDARRDATVPLCVCAAVLTDPKPKLTVQLAVDPRRLVADVVVAAKAALVNPEGPLAPLKRALGQPLDRSDVHAVLHAIEGVVGVASLDLPGAVGELGRRPAERYELIVLDREPAVGGAAA
jgi:hypothetical protein